LPCQVYAWEALGPLKQGQVRLGLSETRRIAVLAIRLGPRGDERARIGSGRDSAPNTAALLCGGGPPESGSALGEARPQSSGPGVAPAADSKPGRQGRALTTAAVTSEKRRQEERRCPWPWEMLSLDSERPVSGRRTQSFGEDKPLPVFHDTTAVSSAELVALAHPAKRHVPDDRTRGRMIDSNL
jgi:hypothetical protein